MIKTLSYYDGNTIALEVIGGVQLADIDRLAQEFNNKLKQGYTQVNLLITLHQLSVRQTNILAVLQERVWGIQQHKKMRHIAIVGKQPELPKQLAWAKKPLTWANWLKTSVYVESVLIHWLNPSAHEQYFDITELDKAMAFVAPNEQL